MGGLKGAHNIIIPSDMHEMAPLQRSIYFAQVEDFELPISVSFAGVAFAVGEDTAGKGHFVGKGSSRSLFLPFCLTFVFL